MKKRDLVDRLLDRLGLRVDRAALAAFGAWLRTEALAGGGIGPDEADHVWERHIADSLAFIVAFEGRTAGTMLDVGSGVGLPGIPVAIALPDMQVTLLDRSGRRTDLAQRAVRVLGLSNVSVACADVADVRERFDVVTMRAVVPPLEAVSLVQLLLEPGGIGVVAASRVRRPTAAWPPGADVVEVPADVLDSPVWLLTIRP